MKRHNDLELPYIESVPSSNEADLPMVIMIHGRGADARDLADLAPAADAGYRWIFPNAPRPFEYMPGMSQGFSWFDGWPPENGSLEVSRERLVKLIYQLSDRYATPLSQIVVSGFSQGGMMALDAGFRLAAPVAGVVAMSGAVYEKGFGEPKTAPTLIVHGIEDEVIPVQAAQQTRRILAARGIDAEYHEFAMGHWVTPESMAVVREFLGRVLAS